MLHARGDTRHRGKKKKRAAGSAEVKMSKKKTPGNMLREWGVLTKTRGEGFKNRGATTGQTAGRRRGSITLGMVQVRGRWGELEVKKRSPLRKKRVGLRWGGCHRPATWEKPWA